METVWHLYIVQNRLGQLYTGITTDVERRVAQHQAGTGAKALKGKGPITLQWHCEVGSRSEATKREMWVKKLTRDKKLALIQGHYRWP